MWITPPALLWNNLTPPSRSGIIRRLLHLVSRGRRGDYVIREIDANNFLLYTPDERLDVFASLAAAQEAAERFDGITPYNRTNN